jgi:hypothetical protein
MEGFSFVTSVTGLNGPNTGKEDDDDDIHYCRSTLNVANEDKCSVSGKSKSLSLVICVSQTAKDVYR